MKEVKIKWEKLGSIEYFLSTNILDINVLSEINQPGIYFWIEKNETVELSNYIGKAGKSSSILKRLLHHIVQQLTLKYSIPKKYNGNRRYIIPKSSKRFELKFGNNKEYDVRHLENISINDKKELLKSAKLYLKNIDLYYSIITEYDLITEIEQELIKDLLPVENTQVTFSREKMYKFIHSGELDEEKIKTLKDNALNELKIDPTRPNKTKI